MSDWTHDDDMRLCDLMAEDRHVIKQMAALLGRTPFAVRARWKKICGRYGEKPDSYIVGVGRVRDQRLMIAPLASAASKPSSKAGAFTSDTVATGGSR